MWAPYDEGTYREVLSHLRPEDVILEIGAGDLRLARRMAPVVRHVYAIEIQSTILASVHTEKGDDRPINLTVQCGDARSLPFPRGITSAVLLMRHCEHFSLYYEKLIAAGCRRLITNARWRMGVEMIALRPTNKPFSTIDIGWYACRCGGTGFVPGAAQDITPRIMDHSHEVNRCPACSPTVKTTTDP
jgi:hypothetical protein